MGHKILGWQNLALNLGFLQQSYIFQWLKMFKISLSAGREAELQLAAINLTI